MTRVSLQVTKACIIVLYTEKCELGASAPSDANNEALMLTRGRTKV